MRRRMWATARVAATVLVGAWAVPVPDALRVFGGRPAPSVAWAQEGEGDADVVTVDAAPELLDGVTARAGP